MSTGVGISLITVGAILLFALRAGSLHWLNLQIVGIILILAGGFGLALPRMSRASGIRFRRWMVPMLSRASGDWVTREEPESTRSPGDGDSPTLADEILGWERDLPI
jgi:hypothetical protein